MFFNNGRKTQEQQLQQKLQEQQQQIKQLLSEKEATAALLKSTAIQRTIATKKIGQVPQPSYDNVSVLFGYRLCYVKQSKLVITGY